MCKFNLNLEGAPQSQYDLTARLKETGVVDPLVYSPTDGPLRQEYERAGIPVKVLSHPLLGVTTAPEYEKGIEIFAGRLVKWRIELLYGNTLQTFYAIEAARKADLPSIWNPRESDPWQTYFDFLPPAVARRALDCFRHPYQVIFVARATQAAWQVLNSHHNFTVVHNGLDRKRFSEALSVWPRDVARERLGISPQERLILSVGTVCDRKNQIEMVHAMKHLSEADISKVRVLIVGDRNDDFSKKIRKALASLSFSRRSRIDIVPESSDVARFYAAADVFVCTSKMESFPRVILEALAARLPIITTPVFGISEQVEDEVSALFYEPGDAAGLAGKISRLIADAELRNKLIANTTVALDGLIDFESMVDSYAELFREAWLSGNSRGRESRRSVEDIVAPG